MSNAPTTRTIRLYCDGELPPDEAARVEQQLRDEAQLTAAVEFERALRDRVGSILKTDCPTPPPGLADRVRAALADAAGEAASDRGPSIAGRLTPPPTKPTTHRAWWRSPVRANIFYVAASLTLVAGAVLYGIFAQNIDTRRGQTLVDVAGEAAAAVAGEHVTCRVDSAVLSIKTEYRTREKARSRLAPYLETVFDLRDVGYVFLGGHTCELPHCGLGSHLFYERRGGSGLVSIHIVPDRQQFTIEGDPSLANLPLDTDMFPENKLCQKDVLVWSHGNHCYLLVVCRDEDVQKVALQMQDALLDASR